MTFILRPLFCLLAITGLLQGNGLEDPAPSVPIPEMQALKSPLLDSSAKEIKDWILNAGHGKYLLSGRAATFKAGGKICGIYFKGQGQLRYTTANRLEFPTTIYNLKKNSTEKPEVSADALSFGVTFEEAVFWFAEFPVPELQGSPAEALTKDFLAQLGYFRERDERPFLHRLALRHLKTTSTPFFHAQLRGHGSFLDSHAGWARFRTG